MKCHLEELVLADTLSPGILHQKVEKKVILLPIALYYCTANLFHVFWLSSGIWNVLRLEFFKGTLFDFIFYMKGTIFKKKKGRGAKETFIQKNIFFQFYFSIAIAISGLVSWLLWASDGTTRYVCMFVDMCMCACIYQIHSVHSLLLGELFLWWIVITKFWMNYHHK